MANGIKDGHDEHPNNENYSNNGMIEDDPNNPKCLPSTSSPLSSSTMTIIKTTTTMEHQQEQPQSSSTQFHNNNNNNTSIIAVGGGGGGGSYPNDDTNHLNSHYSQHKKHFYIPFRFIIAMLAISSCLLLCSTRYNLSIAIVSMVEDSCTPKSSQCSPIIQHNPTISHPHYNTNATSSSFLRLLLPTSLMERISVENIHCNSSSLMKHKLKWNEEQQGLALGSYYWGFAVTHVVGGRFSERYGPKWVTAVGLMSAAFFNSLLPVVASKSFFLFVLLRVIIGCFHGVVHPALFFMFKNWFPKNEQTIALSMLLIGNALGLIINVPILAVISKISPLPSKIPNWSLLFYGGSALHLIWFLFWMLLATDIPEHHRHIKENEIFYIRQNSKNVLETDLHHVPWSRIVKSRVLYASIIAKICWSFNHAIIIDNGPSYLNKIFGFDMLQASLHIAAVYLTTIIVFILCPPLFTILDRHVPCSRTRLRKTFQGITFLGAAITMFRLPSIDCDRYALEILIIINMITQGFTSAGEYPMINEFAGYYSGTVYGIAITFDSMARFIAPIIRGELVHANNWNCVFYITATLNLIGLIAFELCAGTSTRKWALNRELIRQISSNGQLDKPVKKELKIELENPHYRQDINTETEDWKQFKTSTLVQ